MSIKKNRKNPEGKLATYLVAIPVTGVAYVEVEATSEKEAIDKAFEGEGDDEPQLEEWEMHHEICAGNTFHGSLNETYAEFQSFVEAEEPEEKK